MAFEDLPEFLQTVSADGELLRITDEVDPAIDIAAVTELSCRKHEPSPVLLFENVLGSGMPVVTNLLGSLPRFLRAVRGETIPEVVSRLMQGLNPFPAGRDWTFGLGMAVQSEKSRFAPKTVRRGACQQVIRLGKEIDLAEFPALQTWDGESGRSFTAGLVIVPDGSGGRIVESAPVEIVNRDTLQIHWLPGQAGRLACEDHVRAQRQLPVAVTLGGDPVLEYSAGLPLPPFLNPWMFAGILRDEGISLIRGRTVELEVPASAEIVLEGYVDPDPMTGRGVLADRCGRLVPRNDLPQVKLTAVTHRANPFFPAAIRGSTFQDDLPSGALTEQLLLRIIRLLQPAARDLHLPAFGRLQQAVVVGVDSRVPGASRQIADALGGLPVTAATRLILLVDDHIDVRNLPAVWREACGAAVRANVISGRTVLDATTNPATPAMARLPDSPSSRVRQILQKLGVVVDQSGDSPAGTLSESALGT